MSGAPTPPSDSPRSRSFWAALAATGGVKVYSIVAAVVSLSVTARWLGPSGRGEVATISTWATTFASLSGLSLGQIAINRATRHRDIPWLSSTLGTLLSLAALFTLAAWFVAVAIRIGGGFAHADPRLLCVGLAFIPFYLWETYGSSMLFSLGRLSSYNRAQGVGRTVGLVLTVSAAVAGLGPVGVLAAMGIAQAIVALGGLGFLLREAGFVVRPNVGVAKEMIIDGLKLHANTIGLVLLSSSGLLTVSHTLGSETAGHFNLALTLSNLLLIIPQSGAMILYRRIVSEGSDEAWKKQRRALLTLMGILVLMCAVGALTAPFAVPFIAGEPFRPTVRIFIWLLPSTLVQGLAVVLGPQIVSRGWFWQFSLVTLASGAASVALNALLVPTYHALGAVAATWGANAILLVALVTTTVLLERSRRKAPAAPASVPSLASNTDV